MANTPAQKPDTPPEMVWVKAVNGTFHNIFNGAVYGADPKKVSIDAWLQSQIDAGKLEIVAP